MSLTFTFSASSFLTTVCENKNNAKKKVEQDYQADKAIRIIFLWQIKL